MSDGSHDITGLLAAWSKGDEEALNRLIPLVYPQHLSDLPSIEHDRRRTRRRREIAWRKPTYQDLFP